MIAGRAATVAGLLLAIETAGCRSADPALYPPRAGEAIADTIVLDNHWHTSLIFRTRDLPVDFRTQLGAFAQRRYVAVGWGDEGFFRAERITAGLVAQALFYSRGSVMLVFGFDDEPEDHFDPAVVDIYRIGTGQRGLDRTVAAALASFRREGDQIIDAGPGIDFGRFFEADGRYAFYHTCNQWTADCLAAGGLPISGAYATTAGNVAFQIRRLANTAVNGQPIERQAAAPSHAVGWLRHGRP